MFISKAVLRSFMHSRRDSGIGFHHLILIPICDGKHLCNHSYIIHVILHAAFMNFVLECHGNSNK